MRMFFVVACLAIGLAPLRAQDDPKARIAEPSAWQSHEVGDGVFLRQRTFASLFAGPQSLTVLDVRPSKAVRFDLEAPGRRLRTSAMGQTAGALAALNGGFFAIESTGLSIGLLRLDGALVVPANDGQGSLGLDRAGALQLASRPAGDWPEVHEALGAGPMLLSRGAVIDHGERQRQRRHPRSAVGVTADGRVLWLAVDGRTAQAVGMTFEETGTVLAALGCVDGLNLDGGGSTTLWVAGRGVCNFPCDNKRYDHAGERAVANALLLHAPAVVVVDDDAAELRGEGWQQRRDGEAMHGPDFAACATPGAGAVFRAELPRAGRWRVLGWQPRLTEDLAAWRVLLPGAADPVGRAPSPARWVEFGTFTVPAAGPAEVRCEAASGTLVVDALRFVQALD
jgi:hypothetical protein